MSPGTIEGRVGEIEFDLIEGEKTLGKIAQDNGFANSGDMGRWLILHQQRDLWHRLQVHGGAAAPAPKPVRQVRTAPPKEQAPKEQESKTMAPTPDVQQPVDNGDTTADGTPASSYGERVWSYVEKGLKSPKKRTVGKATRVQQLVYELIDVVEEEEEEVKALEEIAELEKKLAAAKAKIKPKAAASPHGEDRSEVRAWARENGFEVSDRGRISPEVQAAYDKAHAG